MILEDARERNAQYSGDDIARFLQEFCPTPRSGPGVARYVRQHHKGYIENVTSGKGLAIPDALKERTRGAIEAARAGQAGSILPVIPRDASVDSETQTSTPPEPFLERAKSAGEPASLEMRGQSENGETCVVGGDLHIPFHDRRTVDLFLEFCECLQPSRIILNGDVMDCYTISKFPKDLRSRIHPTELEAIMRCPTDKETGDKILKSALQREVQLMHDFLRDLRGVCKSAAIDWVYGNHENRLLKLTRRDAPALAGVSRANEDETVLSFGFLCRVDELGVEIHYSETDESSTYWHGVAVGHFKKLSVHAGYAGRILSERKRCPVVQAHTHRIGFCPVTTGDNRFEFGVEGGCLCLIGQEYVHEPNWQQGWTVLHWDGERVIPQPVPVVNGVYYWGNERRGQP